MEDAVDAFDCLAHSVTLADVPLDELDALCDVVEVFATPRRQVVEHAHAVAGLHQALDQV